MMINKTIVGPNGRDLCVDKLPMFVLNMSLRIQEVKDDEVKKILSKMSDVLSLR